MRKRITFIFAIHNHQPVGNFDFVIEEAFQKSYRPFLEVLFEHPKIKIGVHFTGVLHEWVMEHHPELNELLRKMISRGQIQMLSGGYYEPILSVIPSEDRIGQIEKQNRYIRKTLNTEARGMWLAERVWEPTLPSWMARAGMEYTVIDDVHFKYAGLQGNQLYNYYVTEDLGYKINLFPISQELRYVLPFQKAEKTIEYLRSIANIEGDRVVVFADDGEKFGLWPDTYDHIYTRGWLEKFFTLIEENSDWITMKHFSEVIDEHKPAGNIYLPTASYAEMLHWALPNSAFKAYEEFEATLKESELFEKFGVFVRGGFWRNFFSKYSESNNLHKKMMFVAEKVWGNKKNISDKLLKKAKDHLWAGQCNCPYWHGVFGGLYLPHLRTAIYENLIEAENLMDSWTKNDKNARVLVNDFDKNGTDEVIVETATQNFYFSLLDGGTLFEHDLRSEHFNIHDTMARREEGYHKKLLEISAQEKQHKNSEEPASIHDLAIAKEENLDKKLFYDRYLPRSMRMHILPLESNVDSLYMAREMDLSDISTVEFHLSSKKQYNDEIFLKFDAHALILSDGKKAKINLEKIIRIPIKGMGFITEYHLKRISGDDMEVKIAIDHFYSMLGGASDDRYYFSGGENLNKPHLNTKMTLADTTAMGLIDEWKKIKVTLETNKKTEFLVYPVETISLSEAGFERIYQASAIVPVWDVKIGTRAQMFVVKEEIKKTR